MRMRTKKSRGFCKKKNTCLSDINSIDCSYQGSAWDGTRRRNGPIGRMKKIRPMGRDHSLKCFRPMGRDDF